MSAVNTETGEIVDVGAAERRAMKISLRLDAIAENYQAVMPMIREAIELRDDLTLGYRSPGDYVADRFGQALSALGMELRREVVRELTAAGLSTRAIAPVVGVSDVQVHYDRQAGAKPVSTPEAPEGEGQGAGTAFAEDPHPRPPVVGIDGKTYKPPTRAMPRDTAETYLNHVQSLADRAAREAQNLTPEQLRRVRPKADLWTVGLRNSIEVLQHLVDSLDPEENK